MPEKKKRRRQRSPRRPDGLPPSCSAALRRSSTSTSPRLDGLDPLGRRSTPGSTPACACSSCAPSRLPAAPLLELAERLRARGRAAGATFIVNDRADVARLGGAAGVHVGQDDLRPADVRRMLSASRPSSACRPTRRRRSQAALDRAHRLPGHRAGVRDHVQGSGPIRSSASTASRRRAARRRAAAGRSSRSAGSRSTAAAGRPARRRLVGGRHRRPARRRRRPRGRARSSTRVSVADRPLGLAPSAC